MVNLVETDDGQTGNLEQITKDLNEAVEQSRAQDDKAAPNEQKPDPLADVKLDGEDIPAKLRGKTPREIVSIYTNLESQYGRMANDLGQQRVLTDRLLNLKRDSDLVTNGGTAPAESKLPEIKSTDVLENPTAAIDKVVSARLRAEREQQQQQNAQQAAQFAQQQFLTAHPDYESYVSNAQFVEWVQASPSRKRSAALAANGDWAMGTDLLTEYKQLQAEKANKSTAAQQNNLEQARQASLESGGAAGGSKSSGKIYKRADLIRLRIENPTLYYSDEYQGEIMKAYKEKRVR
jgi:hypothetical protein